jgi:hypothetical protein
MHENSEQPQSEPDRDPQAVETDGRLCLRADLEGAPVYEIGPEVWQTPLDKAICDQAEAFAEHAPAGSREDAITAVDLLCPTSSASRSG